MEKFCEQLIHPDSLENPDPKGRKRGKIGAAISILSLIFSISRFSTNSLLESSGFGAFQSGKLKEEFGNDLDLEEEVAFVDDDGEAHDVPNRYVRVHFKELLSIHPTNQPTRSRSSIV